MPSDPAPLRLGAGAGPARVDAQVARQGAALRSLTVGGVRVVCSSSDPALASGIVLVPWPNRVRGARWMLDGIEQRLDVTEPDATGPAPGNAIHGLLADAEYDVESSAADAVVLRARIGSPRGYPFLLDTEVRYRVVPDGIRVRHRVVNRSDRPAPVALGAHPYFCLDELGAADLALQLPARQTLLLGADNLPVELRDVAGTPFDLRRPTPVPDAAPHACYPVEPGEDGRVEASLIGGGRRVTVWGDAGFRWFQVYAPPVFPPLAPGAGVVAIEPMTAPPDALNTGTDLAWLAPGDTWTRRWGVSLTA